MSAIQNLVQQRLAELTPPEKREVKSVSLPIEPGTLRELDRLCYVLQTSRGQLAAQLLAEAVCEAAKALHAGDAT